MWRKYRSIPPLTEADLSDEGWARRKALLDAQGIDVDEYIAREVPRAFKRSPDIKQAQRDFEASGGLSEELSSRAAFYKWAYRSGIAGAISVVLVGAMSIAGAYRHDRILLLAVGGLCVAVILSGTTYSMMLFFRYLPVRKQRGK